MDKVLQLSKGSVKKLREKIKFIKTSYEKQFDLIENKLRKM